MEARELRIRNKVLHNGKIKTVHCITNTSVSFFIGYDPKNREMTQCFLYSGIESVLLTPEILEKCGFEKRNGYHILVSANHRLSYYDDTDEWELCHYSKLDYIQIPVYPKHLHQLQNLYFALTGTELDVNI